MTDETEPPPYSSVTPSAPPYSSVTPIYTIPVPFGRGISNPGFNAPTFGATPHAPPPSYASIFGEPPHPHSPPSHSASIDVLPPLHPTRRSSDSQVPDAIPPSSATPPRRRNSDSATSSTCVPELSSEQQQRQRRSRPKRHRDSYALAFLTCFLCPLIGISSIAHDLPNLRAATQRRTATGDEEARKWTKFIRVKFGFAFVVAIVIIAAVVLFFRQREEGVVRCEPGFYFESNHGKTPPIGFCRLCPTGTFNDKPLKVSDPLFGEGIERCIPCPPGHETRGEDRHACFPCSAGRYAPNSGTTECGLCGHGRTTLLTGQSVCRQCDDTMLAIWRKDEESCHCPAGYLDDAGGGCVKQKTIGGRDCREGSVCGKKSDYYWCRTKEDGGENPNNDTSPWWDFCCADGSACAKRNDSIDTLGCWVDDARDRWRDCWSSGEKEEKKETNYGAIAGGIFIFFVFCGVCGRGGMKKK